MSTTTMDAGAPERAVSTDAPTSLDELATMGVDELRRVYAEAQAPADLHALEGSPEGRMLAVAGPLDRDAARGPLARLARASWFPWHGKTFRVSDAEAGEGINRVAILGDKYRFGLSFGRSAMDGERCVVLDYDRPDNPFFIRAIRDELREVSPGLFLGPALLDVGRAPKLVLFFAVAHR